MAIEGIQPVNMQNVLAVKNYQSVGSLGKAGEQRVKEEFLALFYKEIFKQAFETPELGVWKNEGSSSYSRAVSSDMMAEWMAMKMASSKAFSVDSLFPNAIAEQKK